MAADPQHLPGPAPREQPDVTSHAGSAALRACLKVPSSRAPITSTRSVLQAWLRTLPPQLLARALPGQQQGPWGQPWSCAACLHTPWSPARCHAQPRTLQGSQRLVRWQGPAGGRSWREPGHPQASPSQQGSGTREAQVPRHAGVQRTHTLTRSLALPQGHWPCSIHAMNPSPGKCQGRCQGSASGGQAGPGAWFSRSQVQRLAGPLEEQCGRGPPRNGPYSTWEPRSPLPQQVPGGHLGSPTPRPRPSVRDLGVL